MRIHAIRKPTLQAALQEVRERFGDDAIVLDTVEGPEGATVRIGVEAVARPEPAPSPAAPDAPVASSAPPEAAPSARPAPTPEKPPTPPPSLVAEQIAEALAWHGAPPLVARSLLLAIESAGDLSAEAALADALERVFRFGRPEGLAGPMALVGPPGAGKTATLAKLAAARSLAGAQVAIVNADVETAGARERIGAFATALGVTAVDAADSDAIAQAVDGAGAEAVTFVDTTGRAPADAHDVEDAAAEIAAAGAGVFVISATTAPVEAAEIAAVFAAAGADSMVATQLDVARRIGALLAAADAGDFVIAGVSLGRRVGDGLTALTPASLARLILAPPQPIAAARPRRAPARPQNPYASEGAAA